MDDRRFGVVGKGQHLDDEKVEVLLTALGFEVQDDGPILDSVGCPVTCEMCEREVGMDNWGWILPAEKKAMDVLFICESDDCFAEATMDPDFLEFVFKG